MTKKISLWMVGGIVFMVALIASRGLVSADWRLNGFGQLVYYTNGFVLGDDDGEESHSGSGDNSGSGSHETPKPSETPKTEEHTEEQKVEEQREVKADEVKMERETEQNGVKTKIKIEAKNGKIHLKTELENEDLGEQEEFEIEDRSDDDSIHVATGSSGALTFRRHRTEAETHFPLSVDPETNELIVTTPSGSKTVSVLPDSAVEHMLAGDILDHVSTDSAQPALELGEVNGTLAYRIKGSKVEKFLGLFPVTLQKNALVSAETGELLGTQASLLTRLLDLFAF